MNTKDFDTIPSQHHPLPRRRRAARKAGGPSLAVAFLGAVCVVGVFGLLGLLYSFG